MTTKTCTRCGLVKFTGDFGVKKNTHDGLRAACKPCEVQSNVAYRRTSTGAKALAEYRSNPVIQEQMKRSYSKWVRTDKGKATKQVVDARFPTKSAARVAVRVAVKNGSISKWPTCALPECSKNPEAHHPDYDRPLDVVWLCQSHHKQTHTQI